MLQDQGIEYRNAICVAEFAGTGPFWMGHHSKNVPCLVANACYAVKGAIGICLWSDVSTLIAVAVDDLVVFKDGFHCGLICLKTALTMGDGDFQCLVFLADDKYILADELLVGIFQ